MRRPHRVYVTNSKHWSPAVWDPAPTREIIQLFRQCVAAAVSQHVPVYRGKQVRLEGRVS